MNLKLITTAALSLFAVGCASSADAYAGGTWRLDPRLCPDLREDFRDSLVTRSRRDLREDRRDRRVTNCPASAFVYTPPRGRVVVRTPALPRYYRRVHVGPRGGYYVVNGRRHVNVAVVKF